MNPTQLVLTFQGGFVGTRCTIYGITSQVDDGGSQGQSQWQVVAKIFPEDTNRRQTFALTSDGDQIAIGQLKDLVRVKVVFEESSDFFGRITLYNLDII